MQIIHYLNFTAQVFNGCADAITPISTESASLLRTMSTARMLHVSKLHALGTQPKENSYPAWEFCILTKAILLADDAQDVSDVLEDVVSKELMLKNSHYKKTYEEQEDVFQAVKNHSAVCCYVLDKIRERIAKDIDSTNWICQNCFCDNKHHGEDCWSCGMKSNWFKPLERF